MSKRNWNGHKLFWMGALFPQKGDSGIGKAKVGKGSKVMLVVDDHGLPIGLPLDFAQPHKITPAEQTLKTIRVLQKRGRPVKAGPMYKSRWKIE